MNRFINATLTILIILGLFSCSSKKFDYATAYKFKVKKMYTADKKTSALPETTELSTSIAIIPEITQNPVYAKPVVENVIAAESSKSKKSVKIEKRLRKITEKIEQRFEKRASKKVARSRGINAKVYSGLVIGAGGLVLMILGGSTLTSIGSLGLLVGVILIVWGLLE